MSNPPHSIILEGASNVRDLGGYRGADGRRVKRGLLYRSAALAKLTAADLRTMAALDIRTVADFRGGGERERAPTVLAVPHMVSLPIEPSVGAGLRDLLQRQEHTGEALHSVLAQAYVAYALEQQAQYARLFALLLGGGAPLLFHCSAGKDRTGFGAALVLTALGVAWDDVVADFEATNQLWARDTVPSADIPETIREALLCADPALLTEAFDAARERYGSIDSYFRDGLNVDVPALQAMFLEPDL